MSNLANNKLKAKKMGVLIRDARQVLSKSPQECAQAIGISPETYEAYELGSKSPSLPELEILAYYLNVPLEHFLSEDGLLQETKSEAPADPQKLLSLRQKIIGVLLRKARLERALSLEDLADRTGIQVEKLQVYELGKEPIPVLELNQLALELDWQMRSFQDTAGPVGIWLNQQRYVNDFKSLDADLQEFVSKPVNKPYLEVAQRLSEMSAEKLRTIAETLLEITL